MILKLQEMLLLAQITAITVNKKEKSMFTYCTAPWLLQVLLILNILLFIIIISV